MIEKSKNFSLKLAAYSCRKSGISSSSPASAFPKNKQKVRGSPRGTLGGASRRAGRMWVHVNHFEGFLALFANPLPWREGRICPQLNLLNSQKRPRAVGRAGARPGWALPCGEGAAALPPRPCTPHPALLWGGFRAFELLLCHRPSGFIPPEPGRLLKVQRGDGGSVGLSRQDQICEPHAVVKVGSSRSFPFSSDKV